MSKNTTKTATSNNNNNAAPAPEFSEYNGKPVMTLKSRPDDRYPFSFGLGKARLMVQHIDAIKKFIADHSENGK